MTFDEATAVLGTAGVRRAHDFVASLPPLTEARIEAIARILHAPATARTDEPPQPATTDAA